MFDKDTPSTNLLNTDCAIYKEIARIAEVMRTTEHLRFGRMYYRQISGDGVNFGFPFGTTYTLAFSRVLYGSEVLVAYNISDKPRNEFVVVDASIHKAGDTMNFLYPNQGTVTIQKKTGRRHAFCATEAGPTPVRDLGIGLTNPTTSEA